MCLENNSYFNEKYAIKEQTLSQLSESKVD